MPDVHAKLSASGSHIWMNCPPSVKLSEGIPNEDTYFTLEGTTAHKLAEILLDEELDKNLTGVDSRIVEFKRIESSEFYSEEMHSYIRGYVDWVLEEYNAVRSEDKELLTEQRLDFSSWAPGGFGTGDVVIIADGVLTVIDLKYGKGVPVDAYWNPQLMLYGLGAYDSFSLSNDIHTVRMVINQPRLDSISDFEISVEDLLKWGEEEVKPRAKEALAGGGDQTPGEHCRFCKVKSVCRARAEQMLSIDTEKSKGILSDTEMVGILQKADIVKAYIKDVEDYALQQAKAGYRWPGYKLVEGKSNRRYTDPAEVEKRLTAAGFDKIILYKDPELLGLTAMERVVGGKKKLEQICEGLIVKPPGAPTLVPESDKRPAINAVEFDEED